MSEEPTLALAEEFEVENTRTEDINSNADINSDSARDSSTAPLQVVTPSKNRPQPR